MIDLRTLGRPETASILTERGERCVETAQALTSSCHIAGLQQELSPKCCHYSPHSCVGVTVFSPVGAHVCIIHNERCVREMVGMDGHRDNEWQGQTAVRRRQGQSKCPAVQKVVQVALAITSCGL